MARKPTPCRTFRPSILLLCSIHRPIHREAHLPETEQATRFAARRVIITPQIRYYYTAKQPKVGVLMNILSPSEKYEELVILN